MFNFLILGALVLISLYYLFVFKSRIQKCLQKFPGPPHHPILGILPTLHRLPKKDLLPKLLAWSNDYGGVIRLWSPFGSLLLITESTFIEKLLTSNTNIEKGSDYDLLKPWFGNSLGLSSETSMGKTIDEQDQSHIEYLHAINELIRPWLHYEWIWKLTPMYRKSEKSLKVVHGFTERVIQERKEEILRETSVDTSVKKHDRLPFLDLLLEIQRENKDGELNDQDIREETDALMAAGSDSIANTVGFVLNALGFYPAIQKNVHEELDIIFKDSQYDQEITAADISRMKYLGCVIKECLRLYPSTTWMSRKLISDIELADGRIVPTGSTVGIFLFQLHRDPSKFLDPLAFRPERFLDKNMQGDRDRFAYIPFSAGPRNCIGQKYAMTALKVLTATILRNFNLKSMINPEDLPLGIEIPLKSEIGIPIQITDRG